MVFLIVLGSRPNNPIIFNADKVKSPDHIKSAFREDVAPTFVFEENCDEKRKEIGKDDLKPNVIYGTFRSGSRLTLAELQIQHN